MESPTSCLSTASSSGESFAYNTWNALLELLFHEHNSSILTILVDEFVLAKFGLSCQFDLNIVSYFGKCLRFCIMRHRAPLPVKVSVTMRHHCHTCNFGVLHF